MARAEIRTARLTLRPVAPDDNGPVVSCLNDIAVTGWLAVVPFPYAAADFQTFQAEYAKPGDTFAVHDATGFAGIVGVEDRMLGYWFGFHLHGRGYATEAARAALAEHFADWTDDIASGYFEGNSRSANVLGKLGFVETGRWPKYCRALNTDRPHVQMNPTRAGFVAALPTVAQSERLTYRALQACDLDALHSITSHFDVVRQLASYPWPPEREFTRTRAQPYLGQGFVWGTFRDSDLIGTVAVTGNELGYMLRPDAWGQGFGHEACQTAMTRAFADGLDHLEAGVWADNAASLRLLRKLGFRITADDLTLNKARGQVTPGHLLRLDRPVA